MSLIMCNTAGLRQAHWISHSSKIKYTAVAFLILIQELCQMVHIF